ncbi:MAG TPA: hypothetical protein VHC20_01605 [Candidatus Paceibacterota bacterium]|nr:hypothetical protein [Candidatus Paceibacterota bacterium]
MSLGNGRQEEHPELQALLEQASAQGIWRAAELEGVGEVDARLWLRFRRLDEAAASSPAAALGALDLLPALLGNPSAGPALRSRTVERLVGPLETAEAEPSTAQALANLAVRDLDRVVLGANARVDALIARQLRSRLRIADSEELPALAALINAAIRGGREQQVDGSLREGLAVTTGAPGWELAWSIRPQAAWAAWNLLPNRRREEVGPVFAQLSPSTISGVFPYILEDDELWSWVSERLEVQSYIEREIDRIVVSGGDWPADRRLRLATPRIVQKFLIGPSPPPRLAASISLSLAEQPAYLPSEPSQVPEWLVGLWAREADGRTLRDLLEAHPRLLRYLVLALAQHRLENDAERWGTLLFAAPDAALLTLDGPEALPPWSDVQLRWARRVAPLSVAALPSRALTLETCAAWVGVLPDDPKTIDAIDNAAAADFPIVLALLRHPSAPWLQRRPEIVMQVLAKWWRQDSPRRAPDARTIESFLLELRNAAPQVYEGAASAMLAGILENPEPALGGLAALTFPILHQRLCQGRNERWLVRLLERWWGGHWDRAGRLRERYARAWQEAGWSVTNLWAAADHDEQTFEQLVREVLELGEGSRRLRLAFEELPKRAQRIVKNEM